MIAIARKTSLQVFEFFGKNITYQSCNFVSPGNFTKKAFWVFFFRKMRLVQTPFRTAFLHSHLARDAGFFFFFKSI